MPPLATLQHDIHRRPRQATPAARPGTPRQPPAPSASPGPLPATDWTTYHRDAARTGAAPASPAAGPLAIAWRRRLDGAVYGQPLVVGDLVIAATEGDTVYGLDRATGRVRWHVHLGTPVPLSALPCGDIDPLGITGTPVYDPATRMVYAVAETTGFHHVLAGIAVPSGKLVFSPERPDPGRATARTTSSARRWRWTRAASTWRSAGWPATAGPTRVRSTGSRPAAAGRWSPTGYRRQGRRHAGHRAARSSARPAPSTSARATGPPPPRPWDGSDSVTALTPGLRRTGIFAPITWPQDNASDLDLGSSPPALLSGGRLLIAGKRGTAYLLNASHLAGVGSQVAQAPVCPAYGGLSVAGQVVYLPCEGGGMAAVDTAGNRIKVLWRGPPGAAGSPVLGGGAVWVPDWTTGVLYQLDPGTGQVRHKIRLGTALPHFASPVPVRPARPGRHPARGRGGPRRVSGAAARLKP